MSFKHIDVGAALRRIAEQRIEEAMEEGKFDHLEGQGQPIDLDSMPAEEDQRLRWWALRIFKQNYVVPHEVQWRKQVEGLKAQLQRTVDPAQRRALARQINELVRKVNTLGTNALQGDLAPVDEPPPGE